MRTAGNPQIRLEDLPRTSTAQHTPEQPGVIVAA